MVLPSRAPSTVSQRAPMPHVSTLYQSVDLPQRQSYDARKQLSSQRQVRQIQISRSMPSSPQKRTIDDTKFHPAPHLLATPENAKRDFSPLESSQQHFPEFYSPSSGGESVFELPIVTLESPSSSTNASFVAELEDTSAPGHTPSPPMKLIRVPSTTDTAMLFKSNKLTSRAIIKVVDETIAAIEAANRELLSRAEAAEATAYRLLEQNTRLQIELDECRYSYRLKASPQMCFGTQTSPRHTPHTSVDEKGSPKPKSPVPSAMLFGYQTVLDVPEEPSRKKSVTSLRSTSRNHEVAFSEPLPSHTRPIRMRNLSFDRPRTADAATASARSLPPIPMPPYPPLPAVSSPFLQHSRRHTRTLSLEEVKKIAATKPLPPPGPMSPSVVQGVVEIGLGIKDDGKDDGVANYMSGQRNLKGRKSWIRFRNKEDDTGAGDVREERKKTKECGREREKEREWIKLTIPKADFRLFKRGRKGEERLTAVVWKI